MYTERNIRDPNTLLHNGIISSRWNSGVTAYIRMKMSISASYLSSNWLSIELNDKHASVYFGTFTAAVSFSDPVTQCDVLSACIVKNGKEKQDEIMLHKLWTNIIKFHRSKSAAYFAFREVVFLTERRHSSYPDYVQTPVGILCRTTHETCVKMKGILDKYTLNRSSENSSDKITDI